MRLLYWLYFILCLLLLSACSPPERETIRSGVDNNFPPFTYLNESQQLVGFDVEMMNWITRNQKLKVEYVQIEWDDIIPSLLNKKIDCIASGMSITPERQKILAFSRPYWVSHKVMLARADLAQQMTAHDLLNSGFMIGFQRGTSEALWMREHMNDMNWSVNIMLYVSPEAALDDMMHNKIPAVIMDHATAYTLALGKSLKLYAHFGIPDEEFAIAMRLDDKQMHNLIEQGLANFMGSPVWPELMAEFGLLERDDF